MNARLTSAVLAAMSLASGVAATVGCSDAGLASDAGADATLGDAGRASLLDLRVSTTGDGGASALQPAFSPSIHDYYVRCAAGTNVLTVSMTANTGATAALTKPVSSPSRSMQTLTVDTAESAALVATVTAGASTSEYWVRCLPHDFPGLTMTAYPDAGTPSPGYYLVGNAVVTVGQGGYAMVLDVNGVPVWYHPLASNLAVVDVDNVVTGAISFNPIAFEPTSPSDYYPFELERVSPLGTTLVPPTGYETDEHEFQVSPTSGHYFVFSYTLKSGVDLRGLGIVKAFDAGVLPLGQNSTIQDCTIVEFDEAGAVAHTWSASEHFDPVTDSTYPQTGFGPNAKLPDGGTAYDVYHCNSIDVDPANGNLLVSARGMDSVFYVDWPSGKVLWKMGGADASLDNATYVAVADPFFRQHDARLQHGWAPACNGGSGQISVFDDETGMPGPARAAIYDVIVGGSGDAGCPEAGAEGSATRGHATLALQVKGGNVSGGGGSVRLSADGSRVIGWGIGIPVFTEVTAKGATMLEFEFTAGDVSYRAIKVPVTAFDLTALRNTAGM